MTERPPGSPVTGNSSGSTRDLHKSNLGGAIFGCNHSTMAECHAKNLFGLPYSHFSYVKNIEPGLPLFLFNYSDRKMHGVFEAASHGELNLDPYAWTADGKEKTSFPAQVHVRLRLQCQPLTENQFRKIIADNYYKHKHFWFELDHTQTRSLISLFTPLPLSSYSVWSSVPSSKEKAVPTSLWKAVEKSEGVKPAGAESKRKHKPSAISKNSNWDSEDIEHGILSRTSTSASEDSEYREPITHLNDERNEVNIQGSHSGIYPELVQENRTFLEQHLRGDTVYSEEERPVSCDVIPSKLSALSFEVNNYDAVITCVPTSMPVEIGLLEESSVLPEQEITTTSDLCREDFKFVEIIKKLEARTAALESKQVESDLQIQCLRNGFKELEEKNHQLMIFIKKLLSRKPVKLLGGDISNESFKRYLGPEDAIYLLGGYNGTWLSTLDSFSPSTDKVIPLKSMSSSRQYASAAALNGNLYVIGGQDGSTWLNTVEYYSQRSDEWRSCPPLIHRKGYLAAVTMNDKIFAIGGGDGTESFFDVEMFDPVVDRWFGYQPMIEKRFAPAAGEINGVLYAVGGYDGNTYLQSAERYDPRIPYWTKLPNMKKKRGCHALSVLNEKLYVMGGCDGESMVSSVEVFDPRLDCWVEGEPMHLARGFAAATVLGDSLFIIGGLKDNKIADSNILSSVECYREGTGWTTCDYKSMGKRCYFSAIAM